MINKFLLFIIFLFHCLCRSGGSSSSIGLDEVVLHVPLEVEVGELVCVVQVEKLLELGIGEDNTSVVLVLEGVSANVLVDLLTDLSARHLNTVLLSKELGEVLGDEGGLDKTGRLAIAVRLALLGVLLEGLHLTIDDLIESLKILLKGSNDSGKLLNLGTKLLELGNRLKDSNLVSSSLSDYILYGSNNYLGGSRGSLLLGRRLLGGGGGSLGGGGGGGLRNTGHRWYTV